jgi:hypothetical protein
MLMPADSKEQIAEFNADSEAYTQYARDVEGELNKRFTLVSDSTPILVFLAFALGLWLCHSLCFRFSYHSIERSSSGSFDPALPPAFRSLLTHELHLAPALLQFSCSPMSFFVICSLLLSKGKCARKS